MRTALFKPFDLFLILLCFFLIGACSERKIPPKAVKGVLDLRDWDFERDGNINLDGEWEFYWEEFPTVGAGGDLILPEEKKDFIIVPSSWNGHVVRRSTEKGEIIEEKLGGEGYATYRLKVILPEVFPISMKVIYQGTAYYLYIQNNLLLESIRVGNSKNASIPDRRVSYITFNPNKSELFITISISNFHNFRGGFWRSLTIGNPEEINELRLNNIALELFLAGVLFIMGVYHISLFYLHREDLKSFHFGFFCLLIFLRTLLTGEGILYQKISIIGYSTGIILEYLTLTLSLPIFIEFISDLYMIETIPLFRKVFTISGIVLSCFVVIFPPKYFTMILLPYQIILLLAIIYVIIIVLKATYKKREGAKIILSGLFAFSLFIINDIFYYNNTINTGLYAPYGLVIFIFSQAFLLTSRFANAFHQVKDLSQNLEKKVEDRTRDLELQKQKIEAAYVELQTTQSQLIEAERMASLGQLVGGIAHEINNPIAVIRAHAELLGINNQSTLQEVPLFLDSLSTTEKSIFYTIVDKSIKNREFLNTKEERKRKKEIQKEISEYIEDEDLCSTISEQMVTLRFPHPYKEYVDILGGERFSNFLSMARVFKNQSNSLSSIEIAVEKASRVVFALRSYLNTQLFSEKKEVNLPDELEKALRVYDNYVVGKINSRKEYPHELKYFCTSENLLQVWKNLLFNSIQAMYDTDKKLEIRIEKVKNIPEVLKSYKTSSIVEESIFQRKDSKDWIVVSITDSGVGIPIELQEKVFTPFFTTKSLGEGIGLGLYTCKKIVHEHGGALFFRSGEGTTEFVVVLSS